MYLTILAVILALVLLVYTFLVWNFDYWKKKGVNGPNPKPLVGNFPCVLTQKDHMACDIKKIYESYKKSENYVGIYNCRSPQILITSAEMIRQVLVTDFKNFHDNEASTMVDEKSDFIFANNPFSLTGEEWKERRAEVTPGFTTNRIRTVFPVTNNVCKTLVEYIEKQIKMGPKDGIDAKDLSLRFTSEVVTDCVLGLKANSFSDQPTPILDNTKKLFSQSLVLMSYMFMIGLVPSLKKIKKLRFVPKPIEEFFVNLMKNSLDLRKSQKLQGLNKDRVDFMNYMLDLQEKKNLSVLQLTAHTMTFLLDGFETTASVLSHCFLLLARDPTRQNKLRKEILDKLGETNDFDAILDLEYLDACVNETLRIFPPGPFSLKLCTEAIELVNKNGRSLNVPVGTTIVLPLQAIMSDGDHFPNADAFEPERFLDGGLKSFKDNGTFLAFGDGPRICLGMRFAVTQMKTCIVEVLRNYEIRVNPKTRTDNKFDPTYFLLRLDGGIWLDFEKIH